MDPEAKGISQLAKVFLIASNRCQEQKRQANGQLEMPLIPAIVCMAFSVELNFKAILKAQGKDERGHKLDNLYSKISEPASTLIVDQTGFSDKEFQKKLSDVADVFIDWRYVYEHDSISIDVDFIRRLSSSAQEISTKLTT